MRGGGGGGGGGKVTIAPQFKFWVRNIIPDIAICTWGVSGRNAIRG